MSLAPDKTADATALVARMIAVLRKIPVGDRARFARAQLLRTHPRLVAAFDSIAAEKKRRSVLFASTTAHFREYRLGEAARRGGWHVFHVCNGKPGYDPREVFSFHHQLQDCIELTLACWLFPGHLVHAFALRGDHLALLDGLKPRRLVIDLYDTCAGSLASASEQKIERDIIAHADGITHRDVRIKRLQKLKGYALPKHNIFIHDPLPTVPSTPPSPRPAGEIHVVSAGWVGAGANSILRVAKALCRNGIHLHIYLNPLQTEGHPDAEPYRELQRETPYLHMEEPVYGQAYWQRLRTYDFGLSILEPAIFGEPLSGYTPDAMAGCGSSRLSDYIAAELGVIVSQELRFQHFWARRYAAVCVPASRELLVNPRPILERALAQKKANRPRMRITAEGTSKRLGIFYERVGQSLPNK
jgi:hypothetical protein